MFAKEQLSYLVHKNTVSGHHIVNLQLSKLCFVPKERTVHSFQTVEAENLKTTVYLGHSTIVFYPCSELQH